MKSYQILQMKSRWLLRGTGMALAAFLLSAGAVQEVQAAGPGAVYKHSEGTGLSRAICPKRMPVIGGGGFVETPAGTGFQEEKLRQTYPISDATGVIAFLTTAIGWQAASSNFQDIVVAVAVCASPRPGAKVVAHYESAQDVGVARAFCSADATLTGGGGFVETPPPGGFQEEEVLRQTYPISDATGVIAHGTNAIGWQTASSNFADNVVSIAICTSY